MEKIKDPLVSPRTLTEGELVDAYRRHFGIELGRSGAAGPRMPG